MANSEEYEGFEWDDAKSNATFGERGLDFAAAARVFDGDYIEREDVRQQYGERRFVVTGEVEDVVINHRMDAARPQAAHYQCLAGVKPREARVP